MTPILVRKLWREFVNTKSVTLFFLHSFKSLPTVKACNFFFFETFLCCKLVVQLPLHLESMVESSRRRPSSPIKPTAQRRSPPAVNFELAEKMNEREVFASKPKVVDDRRLVAGSGTSMVANVGYARPLIDRSEPSIAALTFLQSLSLHDDAGEATPPRFLAPLSDGGANHIANGKGKLAHESVGYSRNATPVTLHLGGSGMSTPANGQVERKGNVPSWSTGDERDRVPVQRELDFCKAEIKGLSEKVDKLKAQVKIFRHYLRQVVASEMEECQRAAVKIQANWRGFLTRRELAKLAKDTKPELQKLMTRERLLNLCESYSLVRKGAYVGKLPDVLAKRDDVTNGPLLMRSSAIVIQRHVRGFLVRAALDRYRRESLAAIQIQSVWKGYWMRKRLEQRPSTALLKRKIELQQIRQRQLEACLNRLTESFNKEKQERINLQELVNKLLK